jgi:hypothetical protein
MLLLFGGHRVIGRFLAEPARQAPAFLGFGCFLGFSPFRVFFGGAAEGFVCFAVFLGFGFFARG